MTRGILIWLLIMAVETAHGILRGIYLVPLVGELNASRIGWPIGAGLVLAVNAALSRWIGLTENLKLLSLGLIWAVLTLLFEIMIGFARGLGGARVLAEFVPWQGGLGFFSLLLMLAAPWLATKLRAL
jgi:hypothetical protein